MKPLVIASNMHNEISQLGDWFSCVQNLTDTGIIIVDSGSTDGTIEYCQEQQTTFVFCDNIIQREGYGPARTHLRYLAKKFFPSAHWCLFLDADERIDQSDFHTLRFLKDYLDSHYNAIAFPRIDWHDTARKKMEKDWVASPDWQCRMTRLDAPIEYTRKLHEQISGAIIYANLDNPKIHHFHRSTSKEKRDFVGKLCAKLHMEDKEHGHTYPEHHKEAMYRERYLKEGL